MARQKKETCDIVIIGGGPAGMTAAIYSARQALCTMVISPDLGGRGAWAWRVENYTGYQHISGLELMRKFEEHMLQFDVRYIPDKACHVEPADQDYLVRTEGGRVIRAGAIIVATGRRNRTLDVPGAERLEGRGVAYCATCDAPLFKGEDVAVVGGGNAAVYAALQLSDLARRVVVISNTKLAGESTTIERLKGLPNVEIREGYEPTAIRGREFVTSIDIRPISDHQTTEIPVAGVFVEIGTEPNTAFIKDLVKVDQQGQIKVDCLGRTSRPGIFAAGDVTEIPEKQIIISAGEGARAALTAYRYLQGRRSPS